MIELALVSYKWLKQLRTWMCHQELVEKQVNQDRGRRCGIAGLSKLSSVKSCLVKMYRNTLVLSAKLMWGEEEARVNRSGAPNVSRHQGAGGFSRCSLHRR